MCLATVSRISACIRSSRISLSDEKSAQVDIAEVFTEKGIAFEREVRLSKSAIIDFVVEGVGVEVKLSGASKMAIYNQLVRYAKHESIQCLVLISNLSMGLPETIEGKDVFFLSIGEGWL